MTMYWEENPDELNAEADAFARRWAEMIRKAKSPNPQELADRVREQLAIARQEEEWGKLVESRVMVMLWDIYGHRAYMVPEPIDRINCGSLPKDWA